MFVVIPLLPVAVGAAVCEVIVVVFKWAQCLLIVGAGDERFRGLARWRRFFNDMPILAWLVVESCCVDVFCFQAFDSRLAFPSYLSLFQHGHEYCMALVNYNLTVKRTPPPIYDR